MGQLNIHMTPDFEKELTKYMKIKHLSTKSEAIRLAIREGLAHSIRGTKHANFESWVGLALKAPQRKKTKFRSDKDLWE